MAANAPPAAVLAEVAEAIGRIRRHFLQHEVRSLMVMERTLAGLDRSIAGADRREERT